MTSKLILCFSIIFLIILSDQIIKAIVVRSSFVVSCNTGFAFGIGQSALSGLISSLVLLVVIYALYKEQKKLTYLALSLVIGGGVSNLIDRLIRGCVVDFIDLRIWPAFNLADSAVTIGIGFLIFSILSELMKKRI